MSGSPSENPYFKKLVLSLLCPALLCLFAIPTYAKASRAPATPADPCNSPTVGHPVVGVAGCGAVVTVLAVDGNGNATSWSVTTIDGPYDSGKDDFVIGIINDSGSSLNSITLSTPSGAQGVFRFDEDGPCTIKGTDKQNCYGPTGYEGPDNSFTTISTDKTTGEVLFNTEIPANGTTWFGLEGLPAANVVQQVAALNASGTNTADFSSNGQTVTQTITYPQSTNNPNGSNKIATSNLPISQGTWPQYVPGTPWAVSQCIPRLGNSGNGCSLYVNVCWNNATQTYVQANDTLCPTVDPNGDQGVITIEDTFTWTKQSIPNGTTVSLIAFTPPSTDESLQWTATTGNASTACPTFPGTCYIADTLIDMFGDQTTTRGSRPKSKSWNVSATDVPESLTHVFAERPSGNPAPPAGTSSCPIGAGVQAALNDPNPDSDTYESPTFTTAENQWFNGNCLIDFVVHQAQVPDTIPSLPNSNNNYVAALISQLTYGTGTASSSNDITLTDTPPSVLFDTLSQLQGLTLGGFLGGDGPGKSLHWGSLDTAGINEKNVHLDSTTGDQCPNPIAPGSPFSAPCFSTSPYTVQVNIDSVAPQGTCGSPDGNWHATNVSIACSATDATSGIQSATVLTNATSGPTVPVAGGTAAPFSLTTTVTSGQETSMASTGSEQLCDYASNCATFGPVNGNKVDMRAPVITVSVPTTGQQIPAYASVSSSIVCTDGGSGVASCNGTAEPDIMLPATANVGSPLDTKPNGPGLTPKTLTVGASNNTFDAVGNISSPVMVNYNVSCHFASVILNSPTLKKGISFDPAATMLTDCDPTTQKVVITFTLTGPFGKSCSTSTQLLFFPIPVTIPANTNKNPIPGVILFVPENACSGSGFTFSTNTYSTTGALLDSVSEPVTVQ